MAPVCRVSLTFCVRGFAHGTHTEHLAAPLSVDGLLFSPLPGEETGGSKLVQNLRAVEKDWNLDLPPYSLALNLE